MHPTLKSLALAALLAASALSCGLPSPGSSGSPASPSPSSATAPGSSTAGTSSSDSAATAPGGSAAGSSAASDDGWSFATIPLYLDAMPPRFVSNPDGVLKPETEAELNRMLLYAKVDFDIESCVVAVNHVADGDVEAFSYALFEEFKPNDQMLVIVLAYQDHGVRMEIGHELESKLSEVECQQMLNNILIPYLREDNPDEGLLTLVETLYHKMEKK